MSLLYPVFAVSFTSYELSSYHSDPEWYLEPFEYTFSEEVEPSQMAIRTTHSAYMPECVARLLHNIQVRKELDSYHLGITPEENYEVYRVNDDYVIPF